MERFNTWFKDVFADDNTLRNVRSVVALSVSLGLGALFFGLFNSDNLKALFTYNVAGLSLVAMLAVWVWRLDLQDRAKNDEIQENKDLQVIEEDIIVTSKVERNNDHCIIYADNYNEDKQEFLNKRKTQDRIKRYKDKIDMLKLTAHDLKGYQRAIRYLFSKIPFVKFKTQAYYENEIEELKVKPLVDTSYKKISAKKILAVKVERGKKELHGADLFDYSPTKDGTSKSLIFSLIKFAGIGGSGNMIFASTTNWKTIVIYYLLLIATLIWTTVNRYIKVRYNTRTKYFVVRKNKLLLMKDMIAYHPEVKIDYPLEIIKDVE